MGLGLVALSLALGSTNGGIKDGCVRGWTSGWAAGPASHPWDVSGLERSGNGKDGKQGEPKTGTVDADENGSVTIPMNL